MEQRRVTNIKLIIGILLVLNSSITCTSTTFNVFANQALGYNETIISPQETFELGFFSPGNNSNHYVGIWYKKISSGTVVWVANRNTPLTDTSVELTLTAQGVLIIRNTTTRNVIWSSTNTSTASVKNPIGQLLDTGNFIIYEHGYDISQEDPIWQSFDFITDTLLPGMKMGWNLVTGIERHYTSWKSVNDPASGEFSYRIDIRGYPQLILTDGKKIMFRAGPWNGLRFSGAFNLRPNRIYNFTFVLNKKEVYYQYNLINASVFTRIVLQPNGQIERLLWIDSKNDWNPYLVPQSDICDRYAECGPFGSCNIDNSPVCECLKGFEPASPDQWRVADWSKGCRRTIPLVCEPGEGFNKYSNLKLPDTRWSWYNLTMTIEECEKMCKNNCSCIAYTNSNTSGKGSGCLLWFGELIDIRTVPQNGDTLNIRFPLSELDLRENSKRSGLRRRRIQVIVPVAFVILIILVSICLYYRFNGKNQQQQGTPGNEQDLENQTGDEDLELPQFALSTLLEATNNFSINNKLGEGGFGPVYKGVLEQGIEIAVKQLSKTSSQGVDEFKNEVICISKLQHRNLVKLLGCCIEGNERLLIYEYMPNRSLDSFIFDETESVILDWAKRFNIIKGIARGLLYLHHDSRLRIIHRDLKVSNILLDQDMNPKISDFGIARSFGGNETQANTHRVVGTYGYMAPEYALDGVFSIKSDVFSFGVLVLEIISGKKNRGFIHPEHDHNLIGHAWSVYNEDRSMELIDESLAESCSPTEVLRSIQVGLLCVQQNAGDRPNMSCVIMMLSGESALPQPKQPAFFMDKELLVADFSSSTYLACSISDLTITEVDAR